MRGVQRARFGLQHAQLLQPGLHGRQIAHQPGVAGPGGQRAGDVGLLVFGLGQALACVILGCLLCLQLAAHLRAALRAGRDHLGLVVQPLVEQAHLRP